MDTCLFLMSIFRSRYICVSLCLGEEDRNFIWLFSFLCRLVCAWTSMAVTDSQNPLIDGNTCGSFLQKLQVTLQCFSSVLLQMCMVYKTVRVSLFVAGNMGWGWWERWGARQDAPSDRARVFECVQKKGWAGF